MLKRPTPPSSAPATPAAPRTTAREARGLSRLAELRKGDPMTDAHWPRPGQDIPMKVRSLSDTEVVECHARALAYFEEKAIDLERFGQLVVGAFEDEVTTQILFLACRDPEDTRNSIAEDVADLRDNTTPDERFYVVQLYRSHRAKVDPTLRQLTAEQMGEIVDAIKKLDARRLSAFASSVLASFMLTQGSLLASLLTGRSDTSPSPSELPST